MSEYGSGTDQSSFGTPPVGGFGGPPPFAPRPGGGGGGAGGGGPVQIDPLAVASLCVGLLSIPSCCCCMHGVPVGVVGLVLGIVGLQRIGREPHAWRGRGMAIAGIVLSIAGVLAGLASLVTMFDEPLRTQYMRGFFWPR